MRDRANNQAERKFKVGDRVLIKNTKRDSKKEILYSTPGRITAVKTGAFTINVEKDGCTAQTSFLLFLLSESYMIAERTLGANLLRHCPEGELAEEAEQSDSGVSYRSREVSRDEAVAASSRKDDSDHMEEQEGEDPMEIEEEEEAVIAGGRMLNTNPIFAASSAPMNFSNQMRTLPTKRPRKKKRISEDSY